jgi:hypothetical protein
VSYKGREGVLPLFVFGAGDDFVLQGFAQVTEVVAVAGNPHDQVAVLVWVFLSLAQGIGVHHVELDMMPI